MNDNQVLDAFLEHHGIKGMHWGIRNKSKKPSLTPTQRHERNVRRVHNASRAVLATWFITAMLSSHGHTRSPRSARPAFAHSYITRTIKKNGSIKVKDINRINGQTTLNKDTADWFTNLINDKIKQL